MGISSPGIGSNLDINGIVNSLMQVESRPLTLLQQKEASYQAKVSAFGQVQSALSTFNTAVSSLSDPTKFQTVKANSSDSTIFSTTASADATAGSYSIEVTQRAQAQKLVATGRADTTSTVGEGTITFDFGTITSGSLDTYGHYTGATFASSSSSNTKSIKIDSSNHSLAGIRDAINKANMGVTASIINDGGTSPYRLVLTNSATGAASSMKISVSSDSTGDLAALLSHDPASKTTAGQALSETVTAQDAKFKLDGVTITKASNHVTDAIPGVTLDLNKTNVGAPATLTVTRDTAAASTAITKFVDAYNALAKTLSSVTAYDAKTKTASALTGDATVRSIQVAVKQMITTPVPGASGTFSQLSEVGVGLTKTGTLAVDSTKLSAALSSNPADVTALFAVMGSASDQLVKYNDATAKTQAGTYAVNITSLATQASVAGAAPTQTTIADGTNTLDINIDGKIGKITLTPGSYADAAAVAKEIQAKINGASAFSGSTVTVSADNGVLSFTSTLYGKASYLSITGSAASAVLGKSSANGRGVDVVGTINGKAATGLGQKLTGASGDASEGLSIVVSGGAPGDRGTVSYAKGFSSLLSDLVGTQMLGEKGTLTARTAGLNKTVEGLQADEAKWQTRLIAREAQLRAMYTALDTQISALNSKSTYLTQQLAAIAAQTNGG